MHKYDIRITPAALADIEELATFYLELVDAASAEKFSKDVIDTIERLGTFPEGNAFFDEEHNLRRARLRHHKVSVVYIADNGVYEVVAFSVFHALGKPNELTEKLLKRLKDIS